jgi:hypothetical protein
LFYLGLIPGIDTAFVNKQGKATTSVEIDPHLPEQRIGRASQVMRAAHYHQGAQRAEFSRANAGWQVHGRSAY